MLFNSYTFIFIFLPVTLFIAYLFLKFFRSGFIPWLLAASLFFYGWWNPKYLSLLVASILFNYCIAHLISRTHNTFSKKLSLTVGIIGNLSALFYFKYMNFFIVNINDAFQMTLSTLDILLPLGVSFFTFTQIAFLVDTYQNKVDEINLCRYALFVTYFPHLIAGPIIHHADVMPQFKKIIETNQQQLIKYFTIGLSIFLLGLFKKVCIADLLAPKVDVIFSIPGKGYQISMLDAWTGALAYTFQLYFDFSGYSDMAIGLSYMLAIKLPINFLSPYQAINIIDFWRRWHMTLSRFFRNYLYIPLGGGHNGTMRKFANIFLVMLIVGFWHGAGWTFIAWGAFHGSMLVINHSWLHIKKWLPSALMRAAEQRTIALLIRVFARTVTFMCVVLGWVMFRADNLYTAQSIYAGMFHYHSYYYGSLGLLTNLNYVFIALIFLFCFIFVLFAPNSAQYMRETDAILDWNAINTNSDKTFNQILAWQPKAIHAMLIGMLGYVALVSIANMPSSFLYFNF